MVDGQMYNKVQSYKQQCYTIRRCARTIDQDRKTVRKYCHMSPEEYAATLSASKSRTKILDPYSEEISAELMQYPNITTAIIYDHLREHHEGFKPSYRSVHLWRCEKNLVYRQR